MLPDQPVLKEYKGHKDQLALLEMLALLDPLEPMVLLDHKDLLALKDLLDPLELMVLLDHKDHKGLLDLQGALTALHTVLETWPKAE